MEMLAWGCLAAVTGLGVNLIHPHKIPYAKTPPPPKVTPDPATTVKIQEIDVSTAKDLWDLGEYLIFPGTNMRSTIPSLSTRSSPNRGL